MTKHPPARRRGATLAEVAVSTAVLGVLAVGALDAVGAAATTRERAVERSRGQALADELLAHAMARQYMDWSADSDDSISVSGAELAPGRWGVFNDVDDFHGWSSAPPENADGTPVAGFDANWRREAIVEYVNLRNPGSTKASSDGVKRITVRVFHHDRLVGEAVGFRTAGQDAAEDPTLLDVVGDVVGGVVGGVGGLLGGLLGGGD